MVCHVSESKNNLQNNLNLVLTISQESSGV